MRSGWSRRIERLVRRNRHDRELVGVAELGGLGLGGTGHAGELLVHAEVVLQGDRRPGVVLLLDAHALFGLDRLVQSVGPSSTVEGAPGELVDDLHLAGVDQVLLVAVVELLGAQGLAQLVHVVRRDGVVEVGDPELLLDLLDAGLGRHRRSSSPRRPRSRRRGPSARAMEANW